MSFCAQDFSVLAYANGFTHWHYRTGDSLDALAGTPLAANDNDSGYFSGAREMLRPGDQITVNLLRAEGIGLALFVVADIATNGQIRLTLLAASSQPALMSCAA